MLLPRTGTGTAAPIDQTGERRDCREVLRRKVVIGNNDTESLLNLLPQLDKAKRIDTEVLPKGIGWKDPILLEFHKEVFNQNISKTIFNTAHHRFSIFFY
jgi:hypothetical protein